MVNKMLLMISGDIESNPGPSECFYCSISPELTCYSSCDSTKQTYIPFALHVYIF